MNYFFPLMEKIQGFITTCRLIVNVLCFGIIIEKMRK